MDFGVERISDVLPELLPIWRAHFEETEVAYKGQNFNPDTDAYLRLEASDQFLLFTAREAGKLVGNIGYVVHKSRHTSMPTATEDFLFLLPEARKGFNAVRFIKFAVSILQRLGFEHIGMSSKLTANRDIEPLLRRCGFRCVAKFYYKE
jgi:hypothetical protein